MAQIKHPILCGMLTSKLYIKGVPAAWDRVLPVPQFLQALSSLKRFIVCWLGGWPGLKSFCQCTLWLAYQLPKCVIFFYSTVRLHKCYLFREDFWYNSPADNPFSSIKRAKVVQVLHGLRRFSTAEHSWHFGVEGQCPDVVPFAVMIITSWGGGLCGCSEKQIVFHVVVVDFVVVFIERKQKTKIWYSFFLYSNSCNPCSVYKHLH